MSYSYNRVVRTISSPTTLEAEKNTDYIYLLNTSLIPASEASTANLLHFNEPAGSTTFVDSSFSAVNRGITWTNTGMVSSSVQSKFGGVSMFQNGSGTLFSSGLSYSLGTTGDFTVEGWFYVTAVGGLLGVSGGFGRFGIRQLAANSYNVIGNFYNSNFGGTAPLNAWNHLAVCRSAGQFRIFVNGVCGFDNTNATDFSITSLGVGNQNADAGPFTGYVDDYRFSTIARYPTAATFSVPTSPFPDPQIATASGGLPTLPDARSSTSSYTLKNLSSSAIVTVQTTQSQTIDNQSGVDIAPNQSLTLISDNSNWRVI